MRLNKNYSFSYGQGQQVTKLDFIKTTTNIFKGEATDNKFRFYIDRVCVHECSNDKNREMHMYPAIMFDNYPKTLTYTVTFY